MNKETLDTLNELTKKPIIELALSYMELVTDNMVKDKEIDRLNKEIVELNIKLEDTAFEQLKAKIEMQKDEIDRLNNIINELEKWLKEKENLVCGCGITMDYLYAYENCLEELQELKEGNNGSI